MANLITGLFDTTDAAERAVAQLKQLGYTENEVSIIMKDRDAAAEVAHDTGTRAAEGAGTGAVVGGTLGALLGGILATGSLIIPGIGPILAIGSLAGMLAGAGAGGTLGTFLGWLIGTGVPEDVAHYYERGLSHGGVVVAVASHAGDEQRVRQVLHGGAVAYGGHETPSYVQPEYAARHTDLNPPLGRDVVL